MKKVSKSDIIKKSPFLWEIPANFKMGMRAPARIIAEEAPVAYKDVDAVVRSVSMAGIVTPVAQLRPLAAIKG